MTTEQAKEELSKVIEGYKPLYVNAPLGYTVSVWLCAERSATEFCI